MAAWKEIKASRLRVLGYIRSSERALRRHLGFSVNPWHREGDIFIKPQNVVYVKPLSKDKTDRLFIKKIHVSFFFNQCSNAILTSGEFNISKLWWTSDWEWLQHESCYQDFSLVDINKNSSDMSLFLKWGAGYLLVFMEHQDAKL